MDTFRCKILKVNNPRKTKISNSLGVYDAYKWIRKNKWFDIGRPITEHEFYSIIRTLNKNLVEYFLKGYEIKFPNKMGILELRKYAPVIKLVNNKVVTSLPIDWNETLNLWKEDNTSFQNKILIRRESKEVFKINYNKSKADYNNKTFYYFIPCRSLKQGIKEKILLNQIDAFNL